MRFVYGAHRVRIGVVPGIEGVDIRTIRITRTQRFDQSPLRRRHGVDIRHRRGNRYQRLAERFRLFVFVEIVPRFVVVRADRIGDAPMGHRTGGIVCDRLLEADDRLFVVVAV